VGHPLGHEATFVARYEAHNDEVLAYFADRPGDLLVLRVTEGEGWETLCPFLGLPEPQTPFPHANPAGLREERQRQGQGSGAGRFYTRLTRGLRRTGGR
jgi:hypothetical protein